MKLRKMHGILPTAVLAGVLGVVWFVMSEKDPYHDFKPTRPSNVPADALWAGGADGGVWAFLKGSKTPDHYELKLFDDDGREWIRGRFWNFKQTVVNPAEIAQFNGGQLYFKNGAYLLPIGDQKRLFRDGTSAILKYPEPSLEYTDARELTERLLDSHGVDQSTP